MSGVTLKEVANATIPTPSSGKATVFFSTEEGAPAYKDDGGTVTSLQGDDGELTYNNHGNTGATETIDWSAHYVHRLVLNAATVTISYSNVPATGTFAVIRVWLEQDGTGGRDLAWPAATEWGTVGEPDWTTRAAGDIDIVDLMTVDGGTSVIAVLAGREGPTGQGVPAGGTTGQVLTKQSNSDYDTDWETPTGGSSTTGGTFRLGATDITTTSTSFVDLTNFTITFSTGAHRVLLIATVTAYNSGNNQTYFTFTVDGSEVSSRTNGLMQMAHGQSGSDIQTETLYFLTDALSAASHTFKVQWKVGGGTGTFYGNAINVMNTFSAIEMAF